MIIQTHPWMYRSCPYEYPPNYGKARLERNPAKMRFKELQIPRFCIENIEPEHQSGFQDYRGIPT